MLVGSFLRTLLLVFYIGGWIYPALTYAASARDEYFSAEACYRELNQNKGKQKYRDNWLKCIGKYKAVYLQHPSGSWAPAGLYMSANLYQELYRHSYKSSDKQEALDLYKRVINRYPKSAYRAKAESAIQALTSGKKAKPSEISSAEKTAKEKYNQADACYRNLLKNTRRLKYREFWLQCIAGFQDVYEHDTKGAWAPAGLYMSGKLYSELYNYSYLASDQQTSLSKYQQIITDFPNSLYSKRARAAIEDLSGTARIRMDTPTSKTLPTTQGYPSTGDIQAKAAASSNVEKGIQRQAEPDSMALSKSDTGSGIAIITGLRYWSNPSYTRIVVDADRDVPYSHRLLQKDASISKPQRLYVDIDGGRLGEKIKTIVPINDNLLAGARAGQYAYETVRVVVDIKSFKTYKIFSLNNPFRIVIDVWGEGSDKAIAGESPENTVKKDGPIAPSALARQLALGVRCIVIDPGHGGRDYGAPGCIKGIHEKDIVLKISKRLAKKVREKLGCEVILTRETDKYLTLEERTAIANTHSADLFISIHTNAAKDKRAYGIMTFILNLATDDESIRVAARENATSTKNISDLQTILSELMQNAKINESSRLASHVQKATCEHLGKKYSRVKSKGVKQAPFYVLLGAQMPSVLVETSFISNARECKRLKDPAYQDRLAEGILKGIEKYMKETNPTVFLRNQPAGDKRG